MDKPSKIDRLSLNGEDEWTQKRGTLISVHSGTWEEGQAEGVGRFRFPVWKRTFDLGWIFITAPIWLPLMVFVAVLLKIFSPGPVFFKQRRIGLGGVEFMIFKFRSMKVNAETQTHEGYLQQLIKADVPMTKLDDAGDSRLIPGGRLFRALGLDELPQIFNVIRGEMTLVGPRPCTPHEFSNYTAQQKRRVEVPQGITGLWQINGKNETTFSQMIDWDIQYAETMSPWVDIIIILKTIPALAKQVLTSRMKPRAASKASLAGNDQ